MKYTLDSNLNDFPLQFAAQLRASSLRPLYRIAISRFRTATDTASAWSEAVPPGPSARTLVFLFCA